MLLEIQKINVEARIRPVTDARVGALMNSIADVGLLNPVTVVKEMVIRAGQSVEGYTLVAGAHRLEAMRRLSHKNIRATIVEMDKHERRLAECDENLCGTNLGCAERAMLTALRKECYEFLHPETVHGATLKKGDTPSRQLGDSGTDRFTANTAEMTGKAEHSIQRDAERGEKIHPAAMAKITGTKLDTGAFLDEVKVLPASKQIKFVRGRLKATERKKPTPKKSKLTVVIDPTEQQFEALKQSWSAASADARRRFKAWVLEQETPVSDDETYYDRVES